MDLSANGICSPCYSLIDKFYRESHWGFKYTMGSFFTLEISARAGCPLCGILLASISTTGQDSFRYPRSNLCPITVEVLPTLIVLNSLAVLWIDSTSSIPAVIIQTGRAPNESRISKELKRAAVQRGVYGRAQMDYSLCKKKDVQWEMHGIRRDVDLFPHLCDLGTKTGQQRMAGLVKQWLNTCCTCHEQCGKRQDRVAGLPPLPTRILDVGTLEQPHLYLHIATGGERAEYICLSYCWGRDVPEFKTTAAKVDDLQKHIPFTELPKTIQDAITFTRQLQVRYIWVDALCIIQDDTSNPSDWQLEAARFGSYYQNALCTLAATGSHDSSEGFLLPSVERIYPAYFCTRFLSESKEPLYSTWFPWFPNISTIVGYAPLSKRGWAAQERIMSSRIVHFTRLYVMWECTELFVSENLPEEKDVVARDRIYHLRHALLNLGASSYDLGRVWIRFCVWYVSMKFTRISDRLPALSGVVRLIQHYTGLKYYAGLWENNMVEGLHWFVQVHEGIPEDQDPIGPSWSWATARGSLCTPRLDRSGLSMPGFPHHIKNNLTMTSQVLEIKVQCTGSSDEGVITRGVMTIEGSLSSLNMAELGYKRNAKWENRWDGSNAGYQERIYWDRVPLDAEILRSHPCLQISNHFPGSPSQRINSGLIMIIALILAPERVDAHGLTEYRRVGYGIFKRDDWDKGEIGRKIIRLV